MSISFRWAYYPTNFRAYDCANVAKSKKNDLCADQRISTTANRAKKNKIGTSGANGTKRRDSVTRRAHGIASPLQHRGKPLADRQLVIYNQNLHDGYYTTPSAALSHIEKPGERDSHKAVPIAVTPHRLIAAEVPLELSPAKPSATIWLLS